MTLPVRAPALFHADAVGVTLPIAGPAHVSGAHVMRVRTRLLAEPVPPMRKDTSDIEIPATRRRGRPPRRNTRGGGAHVQSLSRALSLLEHIAASDSGITLSDLAQQVSLAASTTHRLLNTLEQHGFAALDADRGVWFVGVRAFTVGNAFLADRDVVSIARAYMHRLMEHSGESVNLAILDDAQAVFLAQVQCREMMRMLVRLGGRAPLHASGVGKALLATLTPHAANALLARHGLERFTDNTLDSPGALAGDLEGVRRLGYAYDDEEHAVGLRCVAATVHDEYGDAVAAISLSGPRARITDDRITLLGRLVVDSANDITRAMGGQAPAWRRTPA